MRTSACVGRSLPFLLLLLGAFFLSSCATQSARLPPPPPPPPPPAPPPASIELEAPFFPWPPPRASATARIPRNLLEAERGPTRLRDVDRRITEVLEQNGYYESSYYAVPAGFALVTKMEQIESDGTPKQGLQRWIMTPQTLVNFSLTAYLTALFRAAPGYYRVIVFIVTPHAFAQSEVEVRPEEANEWLSGGLNRLPASIGNLDFSREDYACAALIYEFERASEAEEPRIRRPGLIPGRTHLVKAGIWEVFQQ